MSKKNKAEDIEAVSSEEQEVQTEANTQDTEEIVEELSVEEQLQED